MKKYLLVIALITVFTPIVLALLARWYMFIIPLIMGN